MLMIILEIHKYLMKKHDIKSYLELFKKMFIRFLSSSFGRSLAADNPIPKVSGHIKRISLNNQRCRARSMLIDINPN